MRYSIRLKSSIPSTVVLLSLVACAHQPPHPVTPSSTPAEKSQTSLEADFWIPNIVPGSWKYFISDSSNISINNDTTNRVVPIETSIHYSVAVEPVGDSFAISARVDSAALDSPLRTNAQTRDSTTSIELRGVLRKNGRLKVDAQEQISTCSSSSNSIASRIHEIFLPHLENKLKIGDKWSDTVSTTSCHGKIPLIQQTIREFEVRAFTTWQTHNAVEVQRLTNATFISVSTGSNIHLQATGSGSGSATLFFDQKTAVLLESKAETKSTLMIITNRGQFPFTQLTSTHTIIETP